jgi:hypothetical protein
VRHRGTVVPAQGLEDVVRTAEGQCCLGDPAHRLANHALRPVEGRQGIVRETAISTSSKTHPIAEISGSSHASKNTLGRFGKHAAPASSGSLSAHSVPRHCVLFQRDPVSRSN